MKKIVMLALLAATGVCSAQSTNYRSTYVAPHVTQNGTYVQGHMRTTPNATRFDNYSTQGNYNPYTGQAGTVNPYAPARRH